MSTTNQIPPLLYRIFDTPVCKEVELAVSEIGQITPVWDTDCDSWVFEHPLYPESACGDTPEAVVSDYVMSLGNFVQSRLNGTLEPRVEARTKGRGGTRNGAGRPKGSTTALPSKMVRLPIVVADWLKSGDNLQTVLQMIALPHNDVA